MYFEQINFRTRVCPKIFGFIVGYNPIDPVKQWSPTFLSLGIVLTFDSIISARERGVECSHLQVNWVECTFSPRC